MSLGKRRALAIGAGVIAFLFSFQSSVPGALGLAAVAALAVWIAVYPRSRTPKERAR